MDEEECSDCPHSNPHGTAKMKTIKLSRKAYEKIAKFPNPSCAACRVLAEVLRSGLLP